MTVSSLGINTQIQTAVNHQAALKSSGAKSDKLGKLGPDVMAKIASFLSPKEVARSERVSKSWNKFNHITVWRGVHKTQHATPLIDRSTATAKLYKEAFSNPCPSVAFGPAQWNRYFGNIGQFPPLPADIHQILNSPCPFIKGKKKEETHLLVLIPATLNGQPMTLKRLGKIVRNRDPKLKERIYQYYNDKGNHTDTPFETSHWVLLTKDVIEGSRKKSYVDQQASLARYPGYQVPRLSEAASSIYMHFVVTGQRLYTDAPWTYTRCQEKYDAKWQMVVGGFASAGLIVRDGIGHCHVGVAGLWKF